MREREDRAEGWRVVGGGTQPATKGEKEREREAERGGKGGWRRRREAGAARSRAPQCLSVLRMDITSDAADSLLALWHSRLRVSFGGIYHLRSATCRASNPPSMSYRTCLCLPATQPARAVVVGPTSNSGINRRIEM